MKIQYFVPFPLLATVSSISQETSVTMKRTNQHLKSSKIDERLSMLWGGAELKEDSDWYENIQHFLKESSLSYSSDNGGDHLMFDPVVSIMSNTPTSSPEATAKPEDTTIIPKVDPQSNPKSSASGTASTPTPTPDPTPSPTIVQATPTSSPNQSTPDDKAESKESKTLKICPLKTEEDGSSESSESKVVSMTNITFSYAVETRTQDMNFIAPLESAMLDSVAAAVLDCASITGVRALRYESGGDRRLDVVLVDSAPSDIVSPTYSCMPSDTDAVQCVVINGVMTLGFNDKATSDAEHESLSTIKHDMDTDAFISPSIPELVKVRYLGPKLGQNNIDAKSTGLTGNEQTSRKSHTTAIAVSVTIFAIILALVCAKCRHDRNKESDEEFDEEVKFDDKVTSGTDRPSSPSVPASVHETVSETSEEKDIPNETENV